MISIFDSDGNFVQKVSSRIKKLVIDDQRWRNVTDLSMLENVIELYININQYNSKIYIVPKLPPKLVILQCGYGVECNEKLPNTLKKLSIVNICFGSAECDCINLDLLPIGLHTLWISHINGKLDKLQYLPAGLKYLYFGRIHNIGNNLIVNFNYLPPNLIKIASYRMLSLKYLPLNLQCYEYGDSGSFVKTELRRYKLAGVKVCLFKPSKTYNEIFGLL